MPIPQEEITMEKKGDNLLNGMTIKELVKTATLPAGVWERGMVIGQKDDGTSDLVGRTGFDEANIHAVVLETKELKDEGLVQVYFTGEFNMSALIVETGFDKEKLVKPARKLSIIIS